MGLLVDGVWRDNWYDTDSTGGRFVRSESQFRHRVSAERGARFAPEKGRYHLYVSLACPWAHRTLILRKLKGLEDMIDVSVVHPLMLENGWEFATAIAGGGGLCGVECKQRRNGGSKGVLHGARPLLFEGSLEPGTMPPRYCSWITRV